MYHWDWLLETLPARHDFFKSTIFTLNLRRQWKDLVVTGTFTNEESGMRASGLPKYIISLAKLDEMSKEIRAIPQATADIVLSGIGSAQGVTMQNEHIVSPRCRSGVR